MAMSTEKGVEPRPGTKGSVILRLARDGRTTAEIARLVDSTVSSVQGQLYAFRRRGLDLGQYGRERAGSRDSIGRVLPADSVVVSLNRATRQYLASLARRERRTPEEVCARILRCVAEDDLYDAVTER